MYPNANLKALLIFQHRGKKVDQELETCRSVYARKILRWPKFGHFWPK